VTPELGIGLRGDRAFADYPRLGRLAEDLGFDVVTVFGDLGFQPPFPILGAIASVTERVRLGPSCVNPYTMHPAEIAAHVAALDGASSGRAYLGLARGAWLESIGVAQPRPLLALREAAAIVNLVLGGDPGGFRGELFRVEPGFTLKESARRPAVPLMIGTWGERTIELAGAIAAEVKVGGSANPDLVPIARARLARGAAAAGRSDVAGVVLGAVTVVDPDGRAARERARAAVALYFEVVAGLDPTLDVQPDLIDRVGKLLRTGDERAAGAEIPDHLLDRFAFAGTPDEVVARVRAIFDAGARRVEFGAPLGLDIAEGIRLLGERVLPAFS
jgi:5,10-methylenetetrahydromethanopterin reductase